MTQKEKREVFLNLLRQTNRDIISRRELDALCLAHNIKTPQWFTKDPANRAKERGYFKIPSDLRTVVELTENVQFVLNQ